MYVCMYLNTYFVLALKALVVAFEDNFSPHWKQVAEVMEDLVETNKGEFCNFNLSPYLCRGFPYARKLCKSLRSALFSLFIHQPFICS